MFLMPGCRAQRRTYRLINPASQTQNLNFINGSANIVWDFRDGQIAFITLTGSGGVIGTRDFVPGAFALYIKQGGSGSNTVTFTNWFKFPGGVAPVLSTTVGQRDLISGVCDGSFGSCTYANNV